MNYRVTQIKSGHKLAIFVHFYTRVIKTDFYCLAGTMAGKENHLKNGTILVFVEAFAVVWSVRRIAHARSLAHSLVLLLCSPCFNAPIFFHLIEWFWCEGIRSLDSAYSVRLLNAVLFCSWMRPHSILYLVLRHPSSSSSDAQSQ